MSLPHFVQSMNNCTELVKFEARCAWGGTQNRGVCVQCHNQREMGCLRLWDCVASLEKG
jgi:hypothetical protein